MADYDGADVPDPEMAPDFAAREHMQAMGNQDIFAMGTYAGAFREAKKKRLDNGDFFRECVSRYYNIIGANQFYHSADTIMSILSRNPEIVNFMNPVVFVFGIYTIGRTGKISSERIDILFSLNSLTNTIDELGIKRVDVVRYGRWFEAHIKENDRQ